MFVLLTTLPPTVRVLYALPESTPSGVALDAITHGRPYREPRSPQGALSEINRYSGVLFAREAVSALNAVTKRTLA